MTASLTPREAHEKLTASEGAIYLDVRSAPEFAQGHPAGAWNIPILHASAFGMRPNPEFAEVASRVLPKDALIVVGCKSGQRSLMAAQALAQSGFTNVVNLEGGFGGTASCEGWQACGLPSSTEPAPGRTWDELRISS
jgi:rhodanese-related sulfurtransferase